MQKKLTVLFAFAIFVLVVGMQTDGYACHKGGNDPKGCGGTPPDDGGGNSRVKVFFLDTPGDGLMSDGGGIYEDKVDKVSTGIGSTGQGKGNFAMHLSKFAIRKLFLDFSDDKCASPGECFPPSPPFDGFTTGGTNLYTSGVNLIEMGENDPNGNLRLSVNIDLASIEGGIWTLFFYYPSFAACPGSTNIGVTRTGADTWVIVGGQNAVACLAQNVGAADYEFSGLYRMPFQMIVQKK